ncbi:MAG TPA: PQQ-dependent dehydrogenase, methanol/ethanol family [Bryobacteraceae bacterium]|jgi:alcohol dehydrogenase (cytochrome c)
MRLPILLLAASLPALSADETSWTTYGKNYSGWRYSELTAINAGNIRHLAPAWIFQTRAPGGMEATPLVRDGILYVTGTSNHAWAIDLKTGKQIWHYFKSPKKPLGLCCGEVNRGFAIHGDRLFKVNIEDTLVALDRITGKVLWEVEMGDYLKGYSGTVAPLVVKNLVVVGTAGAEFGIRGFIDAYDVATGKRVWRFNTIPYDGEPGGDTWGPAGSRRVGGSTWVTGTYDAQLNLIYWGTGNPGPDMNGDVRPGDNLYTCSMVALDADTGKLKWYFQFTPHDVHDWDAIGDPVLVDLPVAGVTRKAVVQANRNGHYYALDRTNGKLLFVKPYTVVSWTKEFTPEGRPVLVPGQEPSEEGTRACPGLGGGHNWNATTYSPRTGMHYFSSEDGCHLFYRSEQQFVEGQWYQLSTIDLVHGEVNKRSVVAVEAATGQIKWRHELQTSPTGGMLSTASDLLFYGDSAGYLVALDARTGENLWHYQTGSGITAPPITYQFEGKQYLTVASGNLVLTFALTE